MSKSPIVRLSDRQLAKKAMFIDNYLDNSVNAASASKLDANANVSSKNIATLTAEIHKDINIQLNRYLVSQKMDELFGEELANEYIRQLENHEIYCHDESSLCPYCVSINMYPFLLDGMVPLGGDSLAPKHVESYCGSFVNLVFAISSQFAGAIATVEFLMHFDYFARKDYGDNYLETNTHDIENHLQHVVYALNQPAAARGYQSVFWNISIFDKEYFHGIFGDFKYPDEEFSSPVWESIKSLQDFFMSWFNKERSKALLTFPVVTAAMLTENKSPKDKEFARMLANQMSHGNSFFIYMSDNPDSLASCCRLKNEFIEKPQFSYSLGAGGVATGSKNVITINMNRLIQDGRDLKTEIQKIHKYQFAFQKLFEEYKDGGLLSVYDAGYITLDKQFLTIGINGMVEAAEYLGYKATNNKEYIDWVASQLKIIFDENKNGKTKYGAMFNTEFVPAENLGVKFASWDKKAGYKVPRDCYNSYFFPVENDEINSLDKFVLHGQDVVKYLDGGSALHLNLEEYLTEDQWLKLFDVAAQTGCNYWTYNVKITICELCGNIDKRTLNKCPKCDSTNISWATRVIGYLKKVSSFSNERQIEAGQRFYHKDKVA